MHTFARTNMPRCGDAQGAHLCTVSSSFLPALPLLPAMPRGRRRSRLRLPHRNPYRKLVQDEIRLAKMWHEEDDMPPSDIAQLLRRDKSTMTRLLVQRRERKKDGRPKLLDSAKIDEVVACLDHLIVTADGQYEVTVDQLRRNMGIWASCRTISRAMHARKHIVCISHV